MKNYLYTLLITAVVFGTLTLMPSKAYADCTQLYGGGQTCPTTYSFSIQKLVQNPSTGSYVNNLSINDPKYSPNQQVNFEIVVQNTGSQTIPTLTLTDTLPQFISFVSGPGSFNSTNDTLTFTVSNLNPGQSQTYNVSGLVAASNLLPSDQGIICLVNQAQGTDSNGITNTASSQFCVQKSVLGTSTPQVFSTPAITSTPSTGPEMLPLALLFPGGLGGFILRKKSLKK